jgi:uncharacterized membrane protein
VIEFNYKLGWPWVAGIAAIAVLVVWWSYRTAIARPKGGTRLLGLALRLLALAGVACCLLDPQWVDRIKHQQPSRLAVLLDTSRSMSIRDAGADRLSNAQTWLREKVLPQAPPNVALAYFGFDQNCQTFAAGKARTAMPFDSASPTGSVTALANALDQILIAGSAEPLMGVVLCSDGIENAGQDPLAVARLFRRKGVPIYTATFGTTNEPRDIVVEDVQVKKAVLNQARSRVRISVRSAGFDGETVPIQLRFRNEVVARASVKLTGGLQRVELEFAPRIKGYHVFEAVIPAQRDEWLATNNRRLFGLEVIDPTIRVLYMEGTPMQAHQPEWKYLKDALESDPNIKCKALFRWPSTAGTGLNTVDVDPDTGEKVYPVQHPTQGYPRTLAGLLEYDVVINSDIVKESFSAEQLLNTARLVEQYGGGFVMIGGKKAFGAGGYHRTVLDKFVPVAMENDFDTSYQPFQLAVMPQAWNHPLIAFGANRQETMDIWTRKFPPLYGYNRVGRAKPGAFVLAVDPGERTVYGPRIILAAQEVGKGRTMAFTSDTTRSWGKDFETLWGEKANAYGPMSEMNCDCRYFRAFWINAIRWLAAGKVGNTNRPVSLELAQTVCRPAGTVAASVRVLGQNQQVTGQAQVAITVNASNPTNPVFAAQFDVASQLYRANVSVPAAGDYKIAATASFRNSKLGEDSQLLICEDVDVEMDRICADPDLMAMIARTSGGKNLNPENPDPAEIKSIFGNAPPVTMEVRRTPLWDRFGWLVALVSLLSAEWVIRRLRGLA